MSMNQFMHPANIYKKPPNFKELALEYSEFRQFVHQDVNGKIIFDFKNVEALRALTCTLLKKDFNLDVQIPIDKLIPTVPLRLNYILWLEDLLGLAGRTSGIRGIDIGTGASCIYPLLGARKNWTMLATELDPESLTYARDNVKRNNLEGLVTVIPPPEGALLKGAITGAVNFDFCMCNPPFFGSHQELHPEHKSRKLDRPKPRNAFCASATEVVVPGGEVAYVTGLIQESVALGTSVLIYTTMLGHKNSLPGLKKLLREVQVQSFKQTEFCQGHTTRWGLAWTFAPDLDLTQIPVKEKPQKPLIYPVPRLEGFMYTMKAFHRRLVTQLGRLQIEVQEVKHVKNLIEYVIIAFFNSWTHQRRKRRERLKPETLDEACSQLAEMNFSLERPSIAPQKRRFEEEEEDAPQKRIKVTLEEFQRDKIYLKAKLSLVQMEDGDMFLQFFFYEGSGGKEGLHQLLQYIKNHFVEDCAGLE